MKHTSLTIVSMAHAIAMVLFAMQYQSHRSNQEIEKTLKSHVSHLAEQVEMAHVRLTELKDPEQIREYAIHALGMHQVHSSQRKSISIEHAKELKDSACHSILHHV